MRLISAHQGKLITVGDSNWSAATPPPAYTGLTAMDAILPPGGLSRGVVHELLHREEDPPPGFVALTFAIATKPSEEANERRDKETKCTHDGSFTSSLRRSASPSLSSLIAHRSSLLLIWIDLDRTLYPPAVFRAGVDPRDLWIVHPRDANESLWATAESLRCRGVTATIASPPRLTRTDARRLQLAAERGGGTGIFIRPYNRGAAIYAAATRWLVQPARGQRTVQRWKLTLLHGHGGQIGSSFLLEHRRETNTLHTTVELGDRQGAETSKIAG